jgi:hypothetical protein
MRAALLLPRHCYVIFQLLHERATLLPFGPLDFPDLPPCHASPSSAAGILRNIDHAGVSVIEALEQAGFDPSPASIRKMIIPKDKVGAGAGLAWKGCCRPAESQN